MKNISSKLRITIATLVAVLAPAAIVYAALNTLNGQNGASQTFSNDSNVTMSSASNVHSLGWSGVLPVSRGGTGVGSYATGSIPYFDGTNLTQDNTRLWFDGQAINTGGINITDGDAFIYNGALHLLNQTGSVESWIRSGDLSNQIVLEGPDSGAVVLDTSGVHYGNTGYFNFPDRDGTFALLQGASTSTIQIGDIKSCIVMADSDGSGVTYVTANDGVLSATTTQPTNCQ